NHWCSAVENKLANARKITSYIDQNDRPVVFYIGGQTESVTTTMGAGSIISDWIESTGGNSAAEVMGLTSGDVTPEAIWDLNPDIIICAGVYQHINKHVLENEEGWKDLKAVTTDRLYTNPYACFNWDRFGLESQLQINYALMCIQPEIANENGINRESMVKEIIEFYKNYTDFELSREQAENMLDGLRHDGSAEFPVQ
ncbi:MAG: ABC transporter substrate-binding protein, partial [Syntrophomonadaceae bacterium]|nr:ABC transporter substrate-binding protein [Syntrophomonadaceae bacterium]